LLKLKIFLKKHLPSSTYYFLGIVKNWKDIIQSLYFVLDYRVNVSLRKRLKIVFSLYKISFNIDSPHTQAEIIAYIRTILSLSSKSSGVLVEAGCYKGGSTAKFSMAADFVNRKLIVFDSFQGIPRNTEQHDKDIFGGKVGFKQGDYFGTLDEVKANVSKFGKIDSCEFVSGWFEDTLPDFKTEISAIYLDVDLVDSTRTCIKYLYPLLQTGGVLYSQDGHLPLVIDALNDDAFWINEVGCIKPEIIGLGRKKLLKIIK